MKRLFLTLAVLLTIVVGCESASNPDSDFNQGGDKVNGLVPTIVAVGTAIGGPVGAVIGLAGTIFGSGWGVWQKRRRTFENIEATDKYALLENVTATVVDVVESVGANEVDGETIKSKVKAQLVKNNNYEAGKAVISAIKAGIEEGKNGTDNS